MASCSSHTIGDVSSTLGSGTYQGVTAEKNKSFVLQTLLDLACENSRFSSLLAAIEEKRLFSQATLDHSKSKAFKDVHQR